MQHNYVVVADVHEFGVDPVDCIIPAPSRDTILLGDIVDRKNALHSQVKLADERMFKLLDLHPGRYLTGNHECYFQHTTLIEDGILFTHGDIPYYGDKWRMIRLHSTGCGRFLRFFKWIGSKYRTIFPYKPSDKHLTLLSNMARGFNCHTIVIGHKHPKEILTYVHNGVKCVLVPRGISYLTLYS